MARKPQENPQLDMTPMIDVVFELIIFFVVTLTEAQKKDETIELDNGENGIVLTADELPPTRMQIDVGWKVDKNKKPIISGTSYRISMGDVDVTPQQITELVKARKEKIGDFPIFIRADWNVPHHAVRLVMDACTAGGAWKLSFMATHEDKTTKLEGDKVAKNPKTGSYSTSRPRLMSQFPSRVALIKEQQKKKGK